MYPTGLIRLADYINWAQNVGINRVVLFWNIMKYARKRTYKRSRNTRRFKRASTRYAARARFSRRGRRYRRTNINMQTVRVKKLTFGYNLQMQCAGTTSQSGIFRAYVVFCINSGTENVSTITLSDDINETNLLAQIIAPVNTKQLAAWFELYSKTKFMKCVVKYYPAMTEGIAQTNIVGTGPTPTALNFAANANLYTCPIYENVDNIITDQGRLRVKNTTQALNDILAKPYCKEHSLYRRFTRVLVPKLTCGYQTYPNDIIASAATINQKRGGWIDLVRGNATDTDQADNVVIHHGLYITAQPIQQAGLLNTATTNSTYPLAGQKFVIGRLTFTSYIAYKVTT